VKGWRRIRPRRIFIGQSIEWLTNGTSQGPLLVQVLVTLEETGLGFLIGSVAGIVCGIVLGRNKLLSDVFSLYIQIASSIPRVARAADYLLTSLERRLLRWKPAAF
jgi:NitT/TauT family transport system permease protein